MKLPVLYPIADLTSLKHREMAVATFTKQLLDAGAEIVQLRAKDASPQEVLAHAAEMHNVLAGSACEPVMNDRVDLAVLAGWRAVHVGHRDLPVEAVRRVLRGQGDARPSVGVSTHNVHQVIAADAGTADYIAVGPVFSTDTKADTEPVIGLDGVRTMRALTSKPMVAIGGITRENAAAVLAAGADCVAVIGALFAEGETVEQVVRDFLRRLR